MPSFFLRIKAAYVVCWILLATSVFFIPKFTNAQLADVYLNVGGSYTVFLRKGDIQVGKSILSPEMGVGLSFYINDKQNWKIKSEFKYSGRNYNTTFPQTEFQFRAWGLQLNGLAEYPFSQKFSGEAGIGVYFYQTFLFENGVIKLLGDQSKSVDLNLIAGVNYQIYESLFIGFRTSLGLIPMVKVKAVGKFGEMDGKQHLLNAFTPELFLRVKLYRRNKV